MKNIIPTIMAASAACLLAGCETTGLSPREHSGYILSLQTGRTNQIPLKLVLPIRLAVAQIGESAPAMSMLAELAADTNVVASVVGLPLPGDLKNFSGGAASTPAQGDYATRVRAVCNLAQSAGADYVFLFGGDMDSWSRQNMLAALDFTLVGGMIVPATLVGVEGKGAGTLIEAATMQPVFFLNTECKESGRSPDFISDGKTTALRIRVRDQLVEKLRGKLLKKLNSLR